MNQPTLKTKEKLFKNMKLMVILCALPLLALYSIPFLRVGNMGVIALIFLVCPIIHGGVILILERKSKE